MAFNTSSFFAGIGTVIATVAMGFGGSILLTDAFVGKSEIYRRADLNTGRLRVKQPRGRKPPWHRWLSLCNSRPSQWRCRRLLLPSNQDWPRALRTRARGLTILNFSVSRSGKSRSGVPSAEEP